MTAIDAMHAHLDGQPDDQATRLVMADLLEEADDEKAEGYRALAYLKAVAHTEYLDNAWKPAGMWFMWCDHAFGAATGWTWSQARHKRAALPADWYALVRPLNALVDWTPNVWSCFPSRRRADDVAATAFAGLPDERKRELLAALYRPAKVSRKRRSKK